MTVYGWIFMIAAWGVITWLCGFCLYELLSAEDEEDEDAAPSGSAPAPRKENV